MPVGPDEYRAAARLFASGVTIVTVASEGSLHGMTASSFAATSLDPPLILVSLGQSSRTRSMIHDTEVFGVNILSAHQEAVARAFAIPGDKTFEDVPHHRGPHGIPLLEGSLVSMGCRTHEVIRAGDHEIFIAEVLTTEIGEGDPLLYFDRSYRALS
ncbi:MAG: flavin reductase family protein [Actinomycetota bacterium]